MALSRTQISLSEVQRRFLNRLASKEDTSLAGAIRFLVDKEMAAALPSRPDPFFDIIGMVASGQGKTNEEIDATLYGKDWK